MPSGSEVLGNRTIRRQKALAAADSRDGGWADRSRLDATRSVALPCAAVAARTARIGNGKEEVRQAEGRRCAYRQGKKGPAGAGSLRGGLRIGCDRPGKGVGTGPWDLSAASRHTTYPPDEAGNRSRAPRRTTRPETSAAGPCRSG
jgi:hypothetical protein